VSKKKVGERVIHIVG